MMEEVLILAKVIVIGTSNSIMGRKGFIKSLSIEHEVINLSSGRVPFYFHIKTIEENKELIESSDLFIIEHYVNDVNFYAEKLGNKYYQECEYLYQLLSTINTNIINLLFPIKDLGQRPTFNYYKRVKQLTKQYNISIIDLNDYKFESHHYCDPIHINYKASYILGLSLSKIINIFQDEKPHSGRLISSPFKIIDTRSLLEFSPKSELKTFKNSLLEVDYLDIKGEFVIPNLQGMTLKSIGYLNPKDMNNKSGLTVNDKYSFSLASGGYFHELFDQEIIIDSKLTLTPLKGFYSNLPSMMPRGEISGNFDFLFITEILLFTDLEMNYQTAKRNVKSIFLKDLESMLDSMFVDTKTMPSRLPSVTIDTLRDTAILLENIDLQKSYKLMALAHKERPKGPFIKNKLVEYRKKLDNLSSCKN